MMGVIISFSDVYDTLPQKFPQKRPLAYFSSAFYSSSSRSDSPFLCSDIVRHTRFPPDLTPSSMSASKKIKDSDWNYPYSTSRNIFNDYFENLHPYTVISLLQCKVSTIKSTLQYANYWVCSALLYAILSCVHALRSITVLLYQVSSIRLRLLTTAFPRIMISLISKQDRSQIVVGMVIGAASSQPPSCYY